MQECVCAYFLLHSSTAFDKVVLPFIVYFITCIPWPLDFDSQHHSCQFFYSRVHAMMPFTHFSSRLTSFVQISFLKDFTCLKDNIHPNQSAADSLHCIMAKAKKATEPTPRTSKKTKQRRVACPNDHRDSYPDPCQGCQSQKSQPEECLRPRPGTYLREREKDGGILGAFHDQWAEGDDDDICHESEPVKIRERQGFRSERQGRWHRVSPSPNLQRAG